MNHFFQNNKLLSCGTFGCHPYWKKNFGMNFPVESCCCRNIRTHCLYIFNNFLFMVWFGFMMFNATFNNISVISWRSVLLLEETAGPGKNHGPVSSHWPFCLYISRHKYLGFVCDLNEMSCIVCQYFAFLLPTGGHEEEFREHRTECSQVQTVACYIYDMQIKPVHSKRFKSRIYHISMSLFNLSCTNIFQMHFWYNFVVK